MWLIFSSLGHAGEPLAPHDLPGAWNWEPALLAMLVVLDAWYWLGVYRLWRSAGYGHGVLAWQSGAFALGMLALAVALISPLDALSGVLFSAHMAQHMVLILVAAPLLAFSAMPLALLWALPRAWAQAVGRWLKALSGWGRSGVVRPVWNTISQPIGAWVIATGTLWAWHMPVLYQAALHSEAVHAVEHASFVVTTLLFWHVLVQPAGRRRVRYSLGVLYLFTSGLQAGALGALLTFAGQPWYPEYASTVAAWGLTPLADQQLAGLIMWLPGGILYTVIAAVLFVLWLDSMERAQMEVEVEVREYAAHG